MPDKSFEFPVDRSAMMLFARSLLDIRPEFSEPDSEEAKATGGIVASPTFVWSSAHYEPDYRLDLTRPRKEPREARPAGTGGDVGRGLHGEQHFEYFQPIHAGDTLTVTIRQGETWEKEGRRGGKLRFSEQIVDYTNQDGVLCVRARRVGVETEKAVEQ